MNAYWTSVWCCGLGLNVLFDFGKGILHKVDVCMIFIIFCLLYSATMLVSDEAARFSVCFNNLKQPAGVLYITVYNRGDGFMQPDEALVKKLVPVQQTGTITVEFPEITAAGQYAVSAFHDLNGDGKLNTSLVGIPTEPYGFSNNARPRFRAPRWSEAQVYWQAGYPALNVRMEKW